MGASYKTWATDSVYDAAGKPWDGSANKVQPEPREFAQGFSPEIQPSVQHLNWLINQTESLSDAIYRVGIEFIQTKSVTALKSLTDVRDGCIARVTGGGLFFWTLGDTSSDDGRYVLADDAGTGRWRNLLHFYRALPNGIPSLDNNGKVPFKQIAHALVDTSWDDKEFADNFLAGRVEEWWGGAERLYARVGEKIEFEFFLNVMISNPGRDAYPDATFYLAPRVSADNTPRGVLGPTFVEGFRWQAPVTRSLYIKWTYTTVVEAWHRIGLRVEYQPNTGTDTLVLKLIRHGRGWKCYQGTWNAEPGEVGINANNEKYPSAQTQSSTDNAVETR
jgi:hypothetical protein